MSKSKLIMTENLPTPLFLIESATSSMNNADIFAKVVAAPLTKTIYFLLQEKNLPMKQK
jgi:hypothetical protein